MVFTFQTPWGAAITIEAIKTTVAAMNGKIKEVSPGCYKAKWRIHPTHKTEFNYRCRFYVGDDMVRSIVKDTNGPKNIKKFRRLSRMMKFWNTFIEYLLLQYPDIDFGLAPGVPTVSAVKFFGDGTEQVFTSTTKTSPNIGGAIVGGWLFGTAGAIIGGTSGRSHTMGTSRREFTNSLLAKVRYTNGLVLEGTIRKNGSLYNEILVNMSKLSDDIARNN
jgi:hypothetical protein